VKSRLGNRFETAPSTPVNTVKTLTIGYQPYILDDMSIILDTFPRISTLHIIADSLMNIPPPSRLNAVCEIHITPFSTSKDAIKQFAILLAPMVNLETIKLSTYKRPAFARDPADGLVPELGYGSLLLLRLQPSGLFYAAFKRTRVDWDVGKPSILLKTEKSASRRSRTLVLIIINLF